MKTKEIQNGIEVWAVDDEEVSNPCLECCFLGCKYCFGCESHEREDGREVYFLEVKDAD